MRGPPVASNTRMDQTAVHVGACEGRRASRPGGAGLGASPPDRHGLRAAASVSPRRDGGRPMRWRSDRRRATARTRGRSRRTSQPATPSEATAAAWRDPSPAGRRTSCPSRAGPARRRHHDVLRVDVAVAHDPVDPLLPPAMAIDRRPQPGHRRRIDEVADVLEQLVELPPRELVAAWQRDGNRLDRQARARAPPSARPPASRLRRRRRRPAPTPSRRGRRRRTARDERVAGRGRQPPRARAARCERRRPSPTPAARRRRPRRRSSCPVRSSAGHGKVPRLGGAPGDDVGLSHRAGRGLG